MTPNILKIKINRKETHPTFQAVRNLVMDYIQIYDLIPQEIWLYTPDYQELKSLCITQDDPILFMGISIKPYDPDFSLDNGICPCCGRQNIETKEKISG